jgi:hypothetical protein
LEEQAPEVGNINMTDASTIAQQPEAKAPPEASSNEDIKAPLVFSCSKCKTILGDTYSFACSNEPLGLVVLTAASNIQRSPEVYTSKGGDDIGTTYFNFRCASCQKNIGRYYLTTSNDLDNLRERFSFLVSELSSYELGKSQIGDIPDFIDPQPSDVSDNDSTRNASVDAQTSEIYKIKHVITGLAERLQMLEQALGVNGSLANGMNKNGDLKRLRSS